MYKKYTFDYRRFLKNFFIMMVFWVILAVTVLGRSIDTSDEIRFGFEDIDYDVEKEGHFLHALNMEELMLQPETSGIDSIGVKLNITKEDLTKFSDMEYLKNNFYTVDKRTNLLPDDIRPEEFLAMDFSVDTKKDGPKILIFHTHSQEVYSDSKNESEGVWGVGEKLKQLLEEKYNIEVLHHNGVYDRVDGKSQILGAYERMEIDIRKVLRENPSIEVVIDIHRDGVGENVHLVEEVNGKQCAKIMFFNGLCRVYEDGILTEIDSLRNTYLNDNLGLSFNLQLMANAFYPGLTRKVYINAYRYSLHMKAKSILVEVGAQTNTYQEALDAMEPFSEILGEVLAK